MLILEMIESWFRSGELKLPCHFTIMVNAILRKLLLIINEIRQEWFSNSIYNLQGLI
jgi:hypothetical protein